LLSSHTHTQQRHGEREAPKVWQLGGHTTAGVNRKQRSPNSLAGHASGCVGAPHPIGGALSLQIHTPTSYNNKAKQPTTFQHPHDYPTNGTVACSPNALPRPMPIGRKAPQPQSPTAFNLQVSTQMPTPHNRHCLLTACAAEADANRQAPILCARQLGDHNAAAATGGRKHTNLVREKERDTPALR